MLDGEVNVNVSRCRLLSGAKLTSAASGLRVLRCRRPLRRRGISNWQLRSKGKSSSVGKTSGEVSLQSPMGGETVGRRTNGRFLCENSGTYIAPPPHCIRAIRQHDAGREMSTLMRSAWGTGGRRCRHKCIPHKGEIIVRNPVVKNPIPIAVVAFKNPSEDERGSDRRKENRLN